MNRGPELLGAPRVRGQKNLRKKRIRLHKGQFIIQIIGLSILAHKGRPRELRAPRLLLNQGPQSLATPRPALTRHETDNFGVALPSQSLSR